MSKMTPDHLTYALTGAAIDAYRHWRKAVEVLHSHLDLLDLDEIEHVITCSARPLPDISQGLSDVQAQRARDAARDQSNEDME